MPRFARVNLQGKLSRYATSKDIILALCGVVNQDQVLNHAVEFTGDAVNTLSVADRLTIANMTTEWGALCGVFPTDGRLIDWYRERSRLFPDHPRINEKRIHSLKRFKADPDAKYHVDIDLDVSSIQPHVAGPNAVKKLQPVTSLHSVEIQKAYLVSCTNSRLQDLEAAAEVLKGRRIQSGVEFYISAASKGVLTAAIQNGLIFLS